MHYHGKDLPYRTYRENATENIIRWHETLEDKNKIGIARICHDVIVKLGYDP